MAVPTQDSPSEALAAHQAGQEAVDVAALVAEAWLPAARREHQQWLQAETLPRERLLVLEVRPVRAVIEKILFHLR